MSFPNGILNFGITVPVLCGILTLLFPNLCSKHCHVSVSPFRHIFVYKSPWLYVALLWSLVCFSLHLKLAIRPPWPEKKVNTNLKISELLTNTCFHEIPKTNSYYLVGFFWQNYVIELKISENPILRFSSKYLVNRSADHHMFSRKPKTHYSFLRIFGPYNEINESNT